MEDFHKNSHQTISLGKKETGRPHDRLNGNMIPIRFQWSKMTLELLI